MSTYAQGSALCIGLLVCALTGCVSGQQGRPATGWLDRLMRPAGPTGPDAVQMDVALIERPLGDRYLNRELWVDADEQVIVSENRAVLEDNGFRIGQIGGITPVGLQTLLASERSCANPRRIKTVAGKPTKLLLGPEMAACTFKIQREGQPGDANFEHAQCTLEVIPTLTADGRTRLRFIPVVYHGEAKLLPRPATDLSGWVLREERPAERYTQLAWEVSLAPGEFVLVGGRYDHPATLGHQCFLRGDEATPVQRFLVVRTARAAPGLDETPAPVATAPVPAGPTAALASQTARTTVRGSAR